MDKHDHRLEILNRARQIVKDDANITAAEQKELLNMIDILAAAVYDYTAPTSASSKPEQNRVTTRHALLTLLKQQADELDALKKLSLNLTSSLDLQTVLTSVVTEALRLVKNSYSAHIFLYKDEILDFGAALNSDGTRNVPISLPRPEGLTYTIARTGKQLIIEDMSKHPLYKGTPQDWAGSIIGIPLKVSNKVVGVMNLSRTITGGFTTSELRLLTLLADQAAVAIMNASLHLMVSQQALSDIVTGLPNRRALDERLDEEVAFARRTESQFSVIMMDLDGFKVVNDTYGHTIGDEVLRSSFGFLASYMRASDFLARYGGDELTMILRQADATQAKAVTDKILEKMREYFYSLPDKTKISLSVSGGIAVYPAHARNGPDLLRAADAALYQAKKHSRGTFMFAKVMTGPLDPLSLSKSHPES